MPGAGAVHHIKTHPEQLQQSSRHPVGAHQRGRRYARRETQLPSRHRPSPSRTICETG